QHLSALGRVTKINGHTLLIGFPKKRNWQTELETNSKVIIIPEIENPLRSGFPKVLREICEQNKVDVVHFHFSFPVPFSLAVSFKGFNLPVIFHWHNPPKSLINFFTPENTLQGKIIRFISGLVARIADRRVINRHISMSREISHLLVKNRWTDEDKITFLPNGVSINVSDNRIKITKTTSVPVIGTVSNFRPQKDHATLIEAFSILCKSGIDSELWLVGDGPTKPGMEKLVKDLGIESKVRFWGTISHPAEMYHQFSIFALSTHYEGHPLVILEAMSYGLPIVATRISSIPETIAHEVNGLLVNPNDPQDLAQALQNLIENNALARRLGDAGRKFVKQQPTAKDWANHLIELYEQLELEYKRKIT
ncbi:MAG: glycosyltransferase family 4 protein, partial [Ignavibacteriaceae bacterium]